MGALSTIICDISITPEVPAETIINHDFLILLLLSGEVSLKLNNHIYSMRENDLCFIHSGDHFHVDAVDQPLMCIIAIDYHFLLRTFQYHRPVFQINSMEYPMVDYRKFIEKTHAFLEQFFQYPDPADNRRLYMLLDYVYFLQDNYCSEAAVSSPEDKISRRISQIQDYVETNYPSEISLNELSKSLKLTPQYLASFIKKHMNTTFNQYLYKVRMSYAVRDLVHSDETITHIAYAYGFPNTTIFNRLFKSTYQKTPQEYRNQYKQNMQSLAVSEYIPPDYQESLMHYQQYIQEADRQASDLRKNYFPIDVDVTNENSIPYISSPWSILLNLSYAPDCLDISFVEQIRMIQKNLNCKYARISALVHPSMITVDSVEQSYNFRKADDALDILYSLGLKPWILVGKVDPIIYHNMEQINRFPEAFTDFSQVFKKFIYHCINRYSIHEVETWKIEVAFPHRYQEEDPHQNKAFSDFLNYYKNIYQFLKGISERIEVGGPCLIPGLPPAFFDAFFSHLQEYHQIPDFITLSTFPISQYPKDTYVGPLAFSSNPDIIEARLKAASDILSQKFNIDRPLYVVESGFDYASGTPVNDSCFISVFLIKNYLAMSKYVSLISYTLASDLSCDYKNSSTLLGGNNGLLTRHGIKKPAMFALEFLNELGSRMIAQGDNYCVTRAVDGGYRILMYNYKHPDNYYCANPTMGLHSDDVYKIFSDDSKITFEIRMENIPDIRYQVVEYAVNKTNGSILHHWKELHYMKNPKNHLIQTLKHRVQPALSGRTVDSLAHTSISFELEPLEIRLVAIMPDIGE